MSVGAPLGKGLVSSTLAKPFEDQIGDTGGDGESGFHLPHTFSRDVGVFTDTNAPDFLRPIQ
jgi:hypothetical protein